VIKHIATAAVYVSDQDQALRFWIEQVGFVVHSEHKIDAEARWIEVGPPGAESCLVIYPRSMMHDWGERKPSIVFACQEIQGTFELMRDNGVVFKEEPRKLPWSMFATFLDPDGNLYGLRETVDRPSTAR
jgi:lactoylglutathione lyase